jgi:hypothetical protein
MNDSALASRRGPLADPDSESGHGRTCAADAAAADRANALLPGIGALATAALAACGGGGAASPAPAPPAPPPVPATSAAEAVRLLNQASFGANEASVAAVVAVGPSSWIDDQFSRPQTLHRPYIEAAIAAGQPGAPELTYRDFVMDTFWRQALTGADQLRQRVVFALTEIFVVSQTNGDVNNRPRGLASYLDLLGQHAFGNFRDLLEAVSLHPIMGLYLSSLRNQAEDLATGRVPDENFAREVMQLFTIGLYRLNPDASPSPPTATPTCRAWHACSRAGHGPGPTPATRASAAVRRTPTATSGPCSPIRSSTPPPPRASSGRRSRPAPPPRGRCASRWTCCSITPTPARSSAGN